MFTLIQHGLMGHRTDITEHELDLIVAALDLAAEVDSDNDLDDTAAEFDSLKERLAALRDNS